MSDRIGDFVLHRRPHDRLWDRPLRRCALAIARDLGDLLSALVGEQHGHVVHVEDLQTEPGNLVEQGLRCLPYESGPWRLRGARRASAHCAPDSLDRRSQEPEGDQRGLTRRCRTPSDRAAPPRAPAGPRRGRAAAGRSCLSLRMGIEPMGDVRGLPPMPAIGPVTAGDAVAVSEPRSIPAPRAPRPPLDRAPTGVVVANRSVRRKVTFPNVMTSPTLRCGWSTLRPLTNVPLLDPGRAPQCRSPRL